MAAAQLPPSTPQAQYMTQRVDNFDPQNQGTWKQRYWVNDTHFAGKGKGPLFVQISGEAAFNPIWVVADVESMDNAATFGAVVAAVEHRFYGESQPFGDLSTEHLAFLSSEQALADLAVTIAALKEQYEPTAVVVFGGSYSGALAGWFRTKYPHLADVGVATSSPVLAELDFVEYLQVVTKSLENPLVGGSTACTGAVASATAAIEAALKTDAGRQMLSTKFQTCETLSMQSSAQDVSNFLSTIIGSFMGVVQYNIDNNAFEHGGKVNPNTVASVCKTMTTTSATPLDNYAAVSAATNLAFAPSVPAHAQAFGLRAGAPAPDACIDISYSGMIAQLQNTSLASAAAEGGRQWTYQTCAQFAYFQTTDAAAPAQVFGPASFIPLSFYTGMCADIFGAAFTPAVVKANVAFTNTHYGGKDLAGTRIIVPNGNIDPWHALSVTTPDASRETIVPIMVDGGAHCSNMYPASPNDLPSLTAARKQITNQLGKWLPAPGGATA
uniref:Uncharacterized protein n=1 Tax=Bicosoecida sp. CB-2014 TaxID=1486930 RepID=A0A7S1GCM2_9STRA|mmetsp:Transcript_5317/g.19092  ORF Transcript_5317/g.19092 Transcript_5317/m.19092 type:complete len:497 (+) Transcript_5317:100-1590(+)